MMDYIAEEIETDKLIDEIDALLEQSLGNRELRDRVLPPLTEEEKWRIIRKISAEIEARDALFIV